MLAPLLLALLVPALRAVRPLEPGQNDQIEFSSHGHFVGKRPQGELNHDGGNSLAPPSPSGAAPLAQSLLQAAEQTADEVLAKREDTSSSATVLDQFGNETQPLICRNRHTGMKHCYKRGSGGSDSDACHGCDGMKECCNRETGGKCYYVDSGTNSMGTTGQCYLNSQASGSSVMPGSDGSSGSSRSRQKRNVDLAVDGCKQDYNGNEGCESLCYRIWCDTHPYGTCGEFDGDLQSKSNWRAPEDRLIKWSGYQSDKEYQIDLWHEQLKLNIPNGHLDYYIQNLKHHQDYLAGGAMSYETRNEFNVPITKILNAFALRQAYDKANKAFKEKNEKDCNKYVKELESAINDASNYDHYSAMANGLEITRELSEKLSVYTKLLAVTSAGTALLGSTDEKVDKVLRDMAEYHKTAQAILPADFRGELEECQKVYNDLKTRLEKSFSDNIQAADDAVYSGDDKAMIPAIKNLGPLIERMKKMAPLFDGDEYLPKARSTLENMQGTLRTKYNDAVVSAQEKIAMMADRQTLQQEQKDLEPLIKQADEMYDDFKDEYEAMDRSLAQIQALQLLKEAMEYAPRVVDSMRDLENRTADRTPPKPKEGEEDQAAEETREDKSIKREQERLELEKTRAKEKLRKALDACKCAKMSELSLVDLQAEIDKAVYAGQDLGGLPAEEPCPTPKPRNKGASASTGGQGREGGEGGEDGGKKKAWHKKLLGNLFGGAPRSTQPAALACFLFLPLLWLA